MEKRVRELTPGEEENPSLMPEDSNEDPDEFFDMIANRNKIRDNDIAALPGDVDQDVLVDVAEQSTALLHHSLTVTEPKGDDSLHLEDPGDVPGIDIAEEEENIDLPEPSIGPATPSVVPVARSPRSRPPPSPRPRSPPRTSATTRSPPAAEPPKPHDPVAAYEERKKREEMEKEREEAEKRELLTRFFEFEEAGVPCPKRFTLKSDISEMRFEFKKLDDEFNRKKAIAMWKEGVKLVSTMIEVANKKFDPIGWKATDFSDNLDLKLGEMDWALREIHKKYFRRGGKPSPEIFVLLAIGSTAVATHKANSKKEEQRQQKAAAQQQQHQPPFFPPPPQGYYGPPPGWYGPPPGYFGGPPRPGTGMPPPQPGPGKTPPNRQMPPQHFAQPAPPQHFQQPPAQHFQQPPPQQQPQAPQRPTVVSGTGSVPGTNPLSQPAPRQMPDVSRVAPAVPAQMPEPIQQEQPQIPAEPPKRRFVGPPSSGGLGHIEDISKVIGTFAGSRTPAEPPVRRTSNYSSNPDESPADSDSEPSVDLKEPSPPRRTGPLEPPKTASPPQVRWNPETGKLDFD
jgi:hypothetical protein